MSEISTSAAPLRDALLDAIEAHVDDVRDLLFDKICTAYQNLSKIAESPIERMLAGYLLIATNGYTELDFRLPFQAAAPPDFGTIWGCQVQLGPFRVDFFFRCYGGGTFRDLVVECDGHEFHERTKEQARADRSRDRQMVINGIVVMRFTGSEIFADPQGCADEVSRCLELLMDDLNGASRRVDTLTRAP